MIRSTLLLALCTLMVACSPDPSASKVGIAQHVGAMQQLPGYFDLYWDDSSGRLIIKVEEFNQPFLYQSSMALQ